jgi:hypothetical protein
MCDGSVVEGEMPVFAYSPVLGVGELSSSSSTVVFEISYTSTLLRLHSRKINPSKMSSDWMRYFRPHFRPLSIMVAVFYRTASILRGMYFTRNRHTHATCAAPPSPLRHSTTSLHMAATSSSES